MNSVHHAFSLIRSAPAGWLQRWAALMLPELLKKERRVSCGL